MPRLLEQLYAQPQPFEVLYCTDVAAFERQVRLGLMIVCLTPFQLYVGLYDTRLDRTNVGSALAFTGYCRLSSKEHRCVGTVERQTLRGYLQFQTGSGSMLKIDEAATD